MGYCGTKKVKDRYYDQWGREQPLRRLREPLKNDGSLKVLIEKLNYNIPWETKVRVKVNNPELKTHGMTGITSFGQSFDPDSGGYIDSYYERSRYFRESVLCDVKFDKPYIIKKKKYAGQKLKNHSYEVTSCNYDWQNLDFVSFV